MNTACQVQDSLKMARTSLKLWAKDIGLVILAVVIAQVECQKMLLKFLNSNAKMTKALKDA